jgi:transforming growth factor-beta-induced protein
MGVITMKLLANFKVSVVVVVTLLMLVFLFGFNNKKESDKMMARGDMDIVDTAVAAGNFTTLAAALEAADLIEALKGKGPFTVFAPTDSAFEKLPAGTLEDLLKPESKELLGSILKHHVANEIVVLKGRRLKTLNSDRLMINNMGRLTVNDAMIIVKNIPASNGVIHVIDAVLIPGDDESKRTASKIISAAIELGVPLYNCDNVGACAAVYKSALEDLMNFPRGVISSSSMNMIAEVFTSASELHDAGEKAWAFRNVLDTIADELKNNRDMMRE